MIPSAKVSVVGLARDHETLQPVHYFEGFVGHLSERTAIIVDPMLATGNSAVAAVDRLKEARPKSIRFVCLLAAPEGIANMRRHHADVPIITAAIDDEQIEVKARFRQRERFCRFARLRLQAVLRKYVHGEATKHREEDRAEDDRHQHEVSALGS